MTRGATGKNVAFALGVGVAVLLAGVYFWQLSGQMPPAVRDASTASNPALATSGAADPAALAAGPALLLFDTGSDRLPAASMDMLARVAEEARARSGATVEISGFYPSSGDAGVEADLATRRVQAARHALEANGVPAASMRGGIGVTPSGADERTARRVELAVR